MTQLLSKSPRYNLLRILEKLCFSDLTGWMQLMWYALFLP